MISKRKNYALVAALSFSLGALVVFAVSYQSNKEVYELRYLERAIDLKWHITILKALRNDQVESAIKYHDNLVESALIELSSYGTDSTMDYKDQIVPVIDMAKSYANSHGEK